ncbi:MAG: outer membrane lipoprotein-sorting protein [Armatimonadetes bacterium]|nr:outer membrane lipoprotein-sorting protein [Armatimonadota bacterium]
MTLTVRIAYENQQELEKIGKDFGMAYKFSSSKLEFKFPDKFKMTGKTGLMNVTYLVTGTTRRVKAGFVNKTEDISQKPHKRRSALDVGLVDPSIWTQYHIDSVSLTTDDQRPVYLVVMARSNALHKKIKLYIDASQMRLMKRENFEDDGSLIARYIYSKHRSFDGFLLPTEIRVYNEDEKLAGTSEYTSVQVNTGLPDSTFK